MKKKYLEIIKLILGFVGVVLALAYFMYFTLASSNVNQFNMIIISGLILIITVLSTISMFIKKEHIKTWVNIVMAFITILLVTFSLMLNTNIIEGAIKPTLKDFVGMSVDDVILWANENKITIEQIYEYSDSVSEYDVIAQNIKAGLLLSNIKVVTLTVSSGPNYDKEVIISSMVGWNIDEAIKVINTNFLNNVTINYVKSSDAIKDIIITQSIKGQMRRNANLTITVSLGNETATNDIKMIDLKDMTLFNASLWLKRNAINYELTYAFDNNIIRNNVVDQDKELGTMIKLATDKVILTISKGSEITVPDLINMQIGDITSWIIKNKLKIDYQDEYNPTITMGNIISVNYKSGDIIEEGTIIKLVISKGPLKMRAFTSLSEFRSWASEYNIIYQEEYEFNAVAKGNIISFSHAADSILTNNDIITVHLSNGPAVTIPTFVNKSKSSITTTCTNLNLICTFAYSTYSSTIAKDVAMTQNKTAGSKVISGTYVNIGLSKGTALVFTTRFTESQLSIGNAAQTIATLRAWVASQYPDVTFIFYEKASTTYDFDGMIHESSPITDGSSVTQGRSYAIWITRN